MDSELRSDGSFAPRIARAVVFLAVGVATHVWLLQGLAHHPSSLTMPVAGASLVEAAQPIFAMRDDVSEARRRVQVRTEFITIHKGLVWDSDARPSPEPARPVATAGFLRARAATAPNPATEAAAARYQAAFGPRPAAASPHLIDDKPSEDASASLASTRVESSEGALVPVSNRTDLAVELGKQEEEEIVRGVLAEYTRAFERLDVKAAKAIWPSLDDRALQRAFQQLDGQQLRFASCGVSVSGLDANARCRGDATYRPKVGSRVLHLTEREWTFSLARDNDRWQIVNARLQ